MYGKDLSKGNLKKNMILLLIPLMLSTFLYSLYSIVDGIFVGKLIGESGVSAFTNCFPLLLVIQSILEGLIVSASVMVSQLFGSKEEKKLKEFVGVLYLFTIIIAILSSFLMILFSDLWLTLLDTPREIFKITKQYIIIYSIGSIFNYLFVIIMETIKAVGNSKTPLLFVIISTTVNIVLDPIFIKLGYGITGTAFATLISMLIGMIIAIIYLKKNSEILKIDLNYLKLNIKYLKQIFKLGIPIIAEELFVALVAIVAINTVNKDGLISIAAYGIADKLSDAIYIISLSFKTMTTVTVGQFIGSGKSNEIKKVMKEGIKLSIIPSLLVLITVTIFPRQFCKIFISSDEVIEKAIKYIMIIGLPYVMSPIKKVIQGFIAGTGHTKILFMSICISNIVEVSTILILRQTIIPNLIALGIGAALWLIVDMLIVTIYYFSNRWKNGLKDIS